jgi:hypothetical protein
MRKANVTRLCQRESKNVDLRILKQVQPKEQDAKCSWYYFKMDVF